jgi:hypothetical protein
MELVPDLYEPSIDKDGNYVDNLYQFTKNGMYCPCKKDRKKYDTRYSFSCHVNTKVHKHWIETLNNNKKNFYQDNIKLQELVENQKLIIANLEKELKKKTTMVDSLTDVIHKTNHEVSNSLNLLDL